MDGEYEKMLEFKGKYALQSFNNRDNLTNTVGFFNTRAIGVSPKKVDVENRLFNIGLKNTRDQTAKQNPFFGNLHSFTSTSKAKYEPALSREQKSCNQTSEKTYIFNRFQPNLLDPQETVQFANYIGKNGRFQER